MSHQLAKCRLYVSGVYMADFGYIQDFYPPQNRPKSGNKNTDPYGSVVSGGSGWIRTSSVIRQQIYSLPRLSNSGARPIYGAGSGNRTRISSLEGLHTSLCTMPATNSQSSMIIYQYSPKARDYYNKSKIRYT